MSQNYTKENLIPVAPDDIAVGTLAMKVGEEVFVVGDVNVTFSGGGSATYYKCAEVGMPPVEMPEPVFYAPLTAQADTAETGQALTYNTDVTFTTIEGRQCAYFTPNSEVFAITAPATNLSTGSEANSVAMWVYLEEISYNWDSFLMYGIERDIRGDNRSLAINPSGVFFSGAYDVNCFSQTTAEAGKWYHLASTYDGATVKTYINGELQGSLDATLSISENGIVVIGSRVQTGRYLADVQIFDVALTAEQVAELYQPTASTLPVNTWSGYKAFLVADTENNKVYYDFETELTTDALTYGKAFIPEVGNVYNADVTVIAQVMPVPVDVWGELSNRVQSGQVELGEIIEVPNTALTDVGLVEGVIQFEVVAIDNADLVDTTKPHSITLFAKKVLFARAWSEAGGRWHDESTLRPYLQNEFLNCLDAGFASHIQTVNRTHWLYGGGEMTVQDTIFLPSYTEIGFGLNQGVSEGVQWDVMTTDTARTRDMNGHGEYWLSSANHNSSHYVWQVRPAGTKDWNSASRSTGVVPALVFA